ncbi:maltoporin LamB [Psychromonas hadalis]|uniref:maltoporin LamB n=1 Tax=Psychromonas hadalis TaxID=211669 RepID=UPI0003B5D419|nr:maltoporin LamB [Psychromonas hadalis]
MKKLPLAIAVSAAILSSNVMAEASPVEFNGYMRAGTGLGTESGKNPSFEKFKLGRLGNENDLYGEFGFRKEVYNEDGVSFLLDSMIASGVTGNNGWEDGDFNIAQFNVQAKGLFADKEIVLWAGKRYYQRHDIHITDFYYWNTSGTGGGIENIQMGPGRLSVALLQDDGGQFAGNYDDKGDKKYDESVTAYTADIRYAGMPLWSGAELEVGFNYSYANEKNNQTLVADDGMMGTAIITQGFEGGFNKTVLQAGSGSYGAQMVQYGSGAWYDRSGDNNDATGFRIINWGVASFGDSIEFGHQVMFASGSDVGGTDTDDTSYNLVVRPMYKWNQHMRTIVELGAFAETINNVDAGGSKFTIAQAWSAGNSFWARPEIRIFSSYITDNEGTALNGADNEISVGIQAEAWW